MRKVAFLLLIIFYSCSQNKDSGRDLFVLKDTTINEVQNYFVLNLNGDTIRKLNPDKYFFVFGDTIEKIIVVAPKEPEKYGIWSAIDLNEKFLFKVYNTTVDSPSPDEFHFGMIRTVDKNYKIGFANTEGKIVIKHQFEEATAFFNNYAIIGRECKNIPLFDEKHYHKSDCRHYKRECKEYGYINKKGEIIEIGIHTRDELWKKLKFPEFYE